MALHRWLAFSAWGFLAACSGDDSDGACATENVVDDAELVSTTQTLSASTRQAIVRAVEGLAGAPEHAAAARTWSESPASSEPMAGSSSAGAANVPRGRAQP